MRAACVRLGTLATLILAVSAIGMAHEQSDSYLSIMQPESGAALGVEAGQLAIVIVMIPLIHAWRRTAAYRRVLMPAGGAAIASLSVYWFVSRTFA